MQKEEVMSSNNDCPIWIKISDCPMNLVQINERQVPRIECFLEGS